MTKSPRKNVPNVGIELGAASDRATAPGVTFLEITDLWGLSLEMSMYNFVEIFLGNEEVFDAKRISYSELGFVSRILHHKFVLHGLWRNILM